MTITQTSREAAERWHRFHNDYPELADRSLHETIQSASDVNAVQTVKELTEMMVIVQQNREAALLKKLIRR